MAAHTVLTTVNELFWIIPVGGEISHMTYIGNSCGAGSKKTAINYLKIGLIICGSISLSE